MFIEAYLMGMTNAVKAKNDLERLRFMPQKVEGGDLINFEGQTLVGHLTINDVVIFDADRVVKATRCTSALQRDYFEALDKVMPLFKDGSKGVEEKNDAPKEVYGADIYDAVEAGDKKALRKVLKQYKRTKWSALDEDVVDDAIFDIIDCIGGDDLDDAIEIVTELIGEDICEVETTKDEPKATTANSTYVPANEDEADLLLDLEDAVKDEDWDDVELLLKTLPKDHPRYAEFDAHLNEPTTGTDAKDEAPVGDDELTTEEIISEICDDIDVAITNKEDTKELLAELATEAGEDSEEYKEYSTKCNPPKERTRRRRG